MYVLFVKRIVKTSCIFWGGCSEVKTFWNKIQLHLLKNSLQLNMRDVILGILDFENSKYNFVILHAKYYIYVCKWENTRPNYNVFVKFLNSCRETEKYIAVKNDKLKQWGNRWNNIML